MHPRDPVGRPSPRSCSRSPSLCRRDLRVRRRFPRRSVLRLQDGRRRQARRLAVDREVLRGRRRRVRPGAGRRRRTDDRRPPPDRRHHQRAREHQESRDAADRQPPAGRSPPARRTSARRWPSGPARRPSSPSAPASTRARSARRSPPTSCSTNWPPRTIAETELTLREPDRDPVPVAEPRRPRHGRGLVSQVRRARHSKAARCRGRTTGTWATTSTATPSC